MAVRCLGKKKLRTRNWTRLMQCSRSGESRAMSRPALTRDYGNRLRGKGGHVYEGKNWRETSEHAFSAEGESCR